MSAAKFAHSFILTLFCQDKVGIVAAISSHLAKVDGFIVDSQQYADLDEANSSYALNSLRKEVHIRCPSSEHLAQAGA